MFPVKMYVKLVLFVALCYGALGFLAYAVLSRFFESWENVLVLLKVIGAVLAIGCAIA
jgi:hypothetical protein